MLQKPPSYEGSAYRKILFLRYCVFRGVKLGSSGDLTIVESVDRPRFPEVILVACLFSEQVIEHVH